MPGDPVVDQPGDAETESYRAQESQHRQGVRRRPSVRTPEVLGHDSETFYFSFLVAGKAVIFDDFATIMDNCPQTTGWTLHGQELGSRLSRMLSAHPNTITAMEFMGHTGYLHDLLCRLPHLLELMATRTRYLTYYIGIFYSTTATLSLETGTLDDEPPRVWACSRLGTLYMTVASCNAIPAVVRWTFGYISVLSPRLRDVSTCALMPQPLRVYGPGLASFLNINRGLCLLTRLKDLRGLHLGTMDVQAPVNRSQLERDARDVNSRVDEIDEHVAAVAWMYGATPSTTKEKVYQLRLWGLLLDVKLMFDELDKNGLQGWPELRQISFCQAYGAGQSVEKEAAGLLERR